MRLIAALFVLAANPALAAECFHHEDHPDWTITINDPGVEPEMVWKQGAKTVELSTAGSGTGIPTRFAMDDDGNTYQYRFVDKVFVIGMEAYYPGCK